MNNNLHGGKAQATGQARGAAFESANCPALSLRQSWGSIKKPNQTILDFKFGKENLNTTYFRYEFSGKPDSINLKSLNVDLLILNNTTDKHLNFSVIKPANFSTKDILFTSADPSNSFGGPDGQMDTGQFVIISVAKLKQINQDITLQFDIPSLKEIPQFQLLTLKIK